MISLLMTVMLQTIMSLLFFIYSFISSSVIYGKSKRKSRISPHNKGEKARACVDDAVSVDFVRVID
jgi:hypothetical protein